MTRPQYSLVANMLVSDSRVGEKFVEKKKNSKEPNSIDRRTIMSLQEPRKVHFINFWCQAYKKYTRTKYI